MKTEVLKRTFEAAKFPKGSPERKKLNENTLTSEYMTSKKYLAVIHLPETKDLNEIELTSTHPTKKEAEDWVIMMDKKHSLSELIFNK